MTEPAIQRVQGTIEWEDGEVSHFAVLADSTSRWGATREIQGRAVGPCESMHAALVQDGFFDASPRHGTLASWLIEILGETGETVTSVRVSTVFRDDRHWRDGAGYWAVETSDVSDVLEAWKRYDDVHRAYRWPETERPDDPALVSYVGADGSLVMDAWTAMHDNEFPLVVLGEILPTDHVRVTRQQDEPEET